MTTSHSSRSSAARWGWGLALFVLPSSVALAQNGSPLPFFGGGLIGNPPILSGQTWPSIASPPGNLFLPSASDPFMTPAGSVEDLARQLGKMLFWDEQISTANTMSCGTCHIIDAAGTDQRFTVPAPNGKTGSLGMVPQNILNDYRTDTGLQQFRRVTGFNPPTMIAAAFFESIFWDGRAGPEFRDEANVAALPGFGANAGLEAQATDPPKSPVEMAHDGVLWSTGELQTKIGPSQPLVLARTATVPPDIVWAKTGNVTYNEIFDKVYNGHPTFGGFVGATRERFAMAVAMYERTLVPNQADIDTGPLTGKALAGFNRLSTSGCFGCHSSSGNPQLLPTGGFVDPFDSILSDGIRHPAINVPPPNGLTGVKTPSLRNVALKKNFFHNGSLHTLDDLIAFYNGEIPGTNGGPAFFRFNPPLTTAEKDDVRAFFFALTDKRVATESPPFDRPDLYLERVPFGTNKYGLGTPEPGTFGPVPEIIPNVPFIDGDIHYKLGVLGGQPNGTGIALFSFASAPGPAIWVDLAAPNFIGSFSVPLDATGTGTFHAGAVPPGLMGTTFFAQWATLNPTTSQFAFSNAAKFPVQ